MILILAATLEILVFNGDTIGSGYSYLRFDAVSNDEQSDRDTNADGSHQATGYHVTSEISDKLTALSADEARFQEQGAHRQPDVQKVHRRQ